MQKSATKTKTKKVPVLTLSDAISKMGDEGKEISYLKVDAAGAEAEALPQMVESGALRNVRQVRKNVDFDSGITTGKS